MAGHLLVVLDLHPHIVVGNLVVDRDEERWRERDVRRLCPGDGSLGRRRNDVSRIEVHSSGRSGVGRSGNDRFGSHRRDVESGLRHVQSHRGGSQTLIHDGGPMELAGDGESNHVEDQNRNGGAHIHQRDLHQGRSPYGADQNDVRGGGSMGQVGGDALSRVGDQNRRGGVHIHRYDFQNAARRDRSGQSEPRILDHDDDLVDQTRVVDGLDHHCLRENRNHVAPDQGRVVMPQVGDVQIHGLCLDVLPQNDQIVRAVPSHDDRVPAPLLGDLHQARHGEGLVIRALLPDDLVLDLVPGLHLHVSIEVAHPLQVGLVSGHAHHQDHVRWAGRNLTNGRNRHHAAHPQVGARHHVVVQDELRRPARTRGS